ncbi:MAG: hypothetical protein AB1705_06345 [Verrucomicrobiota bacterium]
MDFTDPLSASSVLPVRLAYFKFNDTNWWGEQSQLPLVAIGRLRVGGDEG